LHTYHERYPEDLERPEGHIAQRFWKNLKERVESEGGSVRDEDQVDIEWPLALILVKKM
jgi:hypothetical protein